MGFFTMFAHPTLRDGRRGGGIPFSTDIPSLRDSATGVRACNDAKRAHTSYPPPLLLKKIGQRAEIVTFAADNTKQVMEKAKQKIGQLFDGSLKTKRKLDKESIGKVTKRQLLDISAAGIDLSESYTHTIDNYAIIHSLKKHGDEKTEEPRGQIPITKQDFEKIPDILASYNSLAVEKNSRGQDVIIYQKSYEDGTTLYAEEVKRGKKS
jgi:hypothetical protein